MRNTAMARRIELRKIEIDGHALSYGDLLVSVLTWAPPDRGVTITEMEGLIVALAPVRKAIEAGEEEVVLDEVAWINLTRRVNEFRFRIVHEALVEFARHVREAPEIGVS